MKYERNPPMTIQKKTCGKLVNGVMNELTLRGYLYE